MSQSDPDPITCAAGCKRTAADETAATAAGWEHLPISRRWRCPQCWRELQAINSTMRCMACKRPYQPSRNVAPFAADAPHPSPMTAFVKALAA